MLKHALGHVLTGALPPAAFQQMTLLMEAKIRLVERWRIEPADVDAGDADEGVRRQLVHRLLDASLEALGMSEAQRKIGRRYLRAPTASEKLRQRQVFRLWTLEGCDFGVGQVDLHGAMEVFETWQADRFPDVPHLSVKLFSGIMVDQPGVARDDSSHDRHVVFTGISMKPSVVG